MFSQRGKGAIVFQFSIREMLWLTLIAAVVTGWCIESRRSHQWRQQAEFAVGQLEAVKLGVMTFKDESVVVQSLYYDPPLRETAFHHRGR